VDSSWTRPSGVDHKMGDPKVTMAFNTKIVYMIWWYHHFGKPIYVLYIIYIYYNIYIYCVYIYYTILSVEHWVSQIGSDKSSTMNRPGQFDHFETVTQMSPVSPIHVTQLRWNNQVVCMVKEFGHKVLHLLIEFHVVIGGLCLSWSTSNYKQTRVAKVGLPLGGPQVSLQ